MIIAFSGPMGAGKTHITTAAPPTWQRMAFADPIKEIMALALSTSTETVEAIKLGKQGKDRQDRMRRCLQAIGSDVLRDIWHEDVWADALAARLRAAHNEGKNVIVDGLRFENEMRAVKQLGAFTVFVDPTGSPTPPRRSGHATEQVIHRMRANGQYDFVVMNDHTETAMTLWGRVLAEAQKAQNEKDKASKWLPVHGHHGGTPMPPIPPAQGVASQTRPGHFPFSCSWCGTPKPRKAYAAMPSSPGGHSWRCHDCRRRAHHDQSRHRDDQRKKFQEAGLV